MIMKEIIENEKFRNYPPPRKMLTKLLALAI